MKFIYLPFSCRRIPDGFQPVEAYSNGRSIVVPLVSVVEEDNHNCDVNGCGSFNHVRQFIVKEKEV